MIKRFWLQDKLLVSYYCTVGSL